MQCSGIALNLVAELPFTLRLGKQTNQSVTAFSFLTFFSILQAGLPLLGYLSVVSSSTFCFWWLWWRPGKGMWHHYGLHSGFLTKVFCIMTCISTGTLVLLMTRQARSCQLVSSWGHIFPMVEAIPFLQVWLQMKAGRWLCDSLVFA